MGLKIVTKNTYLLLIFCYISFAPATVCFSTYLRSWRRSLFLLLFSVPSKPPSNVKAVSNTPSSITVSWDPIPRNGQNGIIQGYVVFYREQSSSSWTKSDVKLDYSLELTNLVTGKHYTVCVAGYTKVGRGVKSPQIQNIVVGGKIYFLCKKGPVKMSLTKSIVPVFMTQIKMSFTTRYVITPPPRAGLNRF